jgi:hypothetical protein
MKRWMLGLLALLFSATLAVAQQQPPTPVTPHAGDIPQIVAFDNDGLLGDHIHIFGDTPDLGKWGNSISPMVILAGRWEFFDEEKRTIVSPRSGSSSPWGANGAGSPLGGGHPLPEPSTRGSSAKVDEERWGILLPSRVAGAAPSQEDY